MQPAQATIVDGSPVHHYKPGWTLYAADELSRGRVQAAMADMIPTGVNFVNQYVTKVEPDSNRVVLANGETVTYEALVLSPGLQNNWNKIEGLLEAIRDPTRNVVSIYSHECLDKTKRLRLQRFERAIFTQPSTAINCGGAPQKVMYIMHDIWKKQGFNPHIKFIQGTPALFGVPFYASKLETIIKQRGIENIRNLELV